MLEPHWINVYPGNCFGFAHSSRRDAQIFGKGSAIYRIKVTLKCSE